MNSIIKTCISEGNFVLHSGQRSKYLFDVLKLIDKEEFLSEFYRFVHCDFIVGIEFGGAILASINSGRNLRFAIIRKDGTIYGDKIPKDYVLLDDVVTTENSVRKAMEQLGGLGHYPDEIRCIVDRRNKENKSLHIESMLEWNEEEI